MSYSASSSCLYEGWVRHRRHSPAQHELKVKTYMAYLNLDDLPQILDRSRWWSSKRAAVASIRSRDYMGKSESGFRALSERVKAKVAEHAGQAPAGPVCLLTQPRTLGQLANPVSFYYCFDEDGETLSAVAAEVTNTPWRERHTYVLSRGELDGAVLRNQIEKEFHVSPLMGMDHSYDWRMSTPGNGLQVHIDSSREGEIVFDATLSLNRTELTGTNLRKVLLRYPALPTRIMGGIYVHALLTRLKGAQAFPHPKPLRNAE